jgi:hypothetical protein
MKKLHGQDCSGKGYLQWLEVQKDIVCSDIIFSVDMEGLSTELNAKNGNLMKIATHLRCVLLSQAKARKIYKIEFADVESLAEFQNCVLSETNANNLQWHFFHAMVMSLDLDHYPSSESRWRMHLNPARRMHLCTS